MPQAASADRWDLMEGEVLDEGPSKTPVDTRQLHGLSDK